MFLKGARIKNLIFVKALQEMRIMVLTAEVVQVLLPANETLQVRHQGRKLKVIIQGKEAVRLF